MIARSPRNLRSAAVLILSLCLAGCGSTPSPKPLTVSTSPSSLGPILIAQDSVSIAEYCLHAAGSRIGRELPPTAKQTLYERRALRSLQDEAETHPDTIYRGVPLRDQLLKLAQILSVGRCDPGGARLLRELAQSLH
jgi:hypothetical protein